MNATQRNDNNGAFHADIPGQILAFLKKYRNMKKRSNFDRFFTFILVRPFFTDSPDSGESNWGCSASQAMDKALVNACSEAVD